MQQTSCTCCGTCCRAGGPPMHTQDLELVRRGVLGFEDLVTIRRGEYVVPPLGDRPVAAESEWLKVRGKGENWCCRFLEEQTNTCTIYRDRPLSCRVLQCWNPDGVLAMAGRELLTRFDLISGDDPLLALVRLHERQCPVPDMELTASTLAREDVRKRELDSLRELVEVDLEFRMRVSREHRLPVQRELFYFGRPLFQLLAPLGVELIEVGGGITLRFRT